MANETITIALSGDVTLEVFSTAVRDFASLVDALSGEVAGADKPEWIVEYLDAGSATLTFVGEAADETAVDRVIHAYEQVGHSLAEGRPIPYSQNVERAARRITSILDGRVAAVRFETARESVTLVSPSVQVEAPKLIHAYGAVEGRIQTLSSRGGLRFVLYDSLFGRAVYCYLPPGGEEMMRGAWDRRAVVEGWVSRDPVSGRPMSIRNVTNVRLLDEIEPGSYRRARGAVPQRKNEPLPEDIVRKLRDAS